MKIVAPEPGVPTGAREWRGQGDRLGVLMPASPALGPFLADLESRLLALSADELRAALVAHAERLPSDQRASFLSIFWPAPASEPMPAASGWSEAKPDDPLLASVDDFV